MNNELNIHQVLILHHILLVINIYVTLMSVDNI